MKQLSVAKRRGVFALICGVSVVGLGAGMQPATLEAPAKVEGAAKLEKFEQEIPGAAFKVEMVPIPGDAAKGIKPFWMSKTEITWDAYDAFLLNLDDEKGLPPLAEDAVTRPSRPYIPPDCGFGHAGYAAICVAFKNVNEYCRWLSARTGKKYRLATEEEWEHACLAGSKGPYSFGDDAGKLAEHAWFAANSEESPHPVAQKEPNAWGLYDMHGNIAEWVSTKDGKGCIKGGSWESKPDECKASWRAEYEVKWQKTDPQIPKSKWWLSDGQFLGFRIVCESDEPKK